LRTLLVAACLALFSLSLAGGAAAHCQVPCGIYDDPARIAAMREDAQTIAKAIASINEMSAKHDAQAINQAVRWINTKEEHASRIITTVSEYFLTQKLKPVAMGEEGHDGYLEKLAAHHAVLRAAMTCKQTADPASAEALSKAIAGIAGYWE
jgi:nickel superoxide dismutase